MKKKKKKLLINWQMLHQNDNKWLGFIELSRITGLPCNNVNWLQYKKRHLIKINSIHKIESNTSVKKLLYFEEAPSVCVEPESLEFNTKVCLSIWSLSCRFPSANSFSLFAMSQSQPLGCGFFLQAGLWAFLLKTTTL